MHEIYKDTTVIHISPLLCVLSSIYTNKRIYVTIRHFFKKKSKILNVLFAVCN